MTAPLQGAIFDVDGVLVDSPHEKAWRESLRELMQSELGWNVEIAKYLEKIPIQ